MSESIRRTIGQRVSTQQPLDTDPIVRLFMRQTGLPIDRVELVRVEGPDGTVTTYPQERAIPDHAVAELLDRPPRNEGPAAVQPDLQPARLKSGS